MARVAAPSAAAGEIGAVTADRILVVNPLPSRSRATPSHRPAIASPLYLAGKALDALFADRVAADLDRLAHTTAIVRAGRRRFGPSFETEIDADLASGGHAPLRAIDALCIEPSRDLGALAAEHVTSRRFAESAGPAGRLLRWIADGDPQRVGDLLAFLLFDGGFAATLIDLGRADASARRDELHALLDHARSSGTTRREL
jgi:NTE family protein